MVRIQSKVSQWWKEFILIIRLNRTGSRKPTYASENDYDNEENNNKNIGLQQLTQKVIEKKWKQNQ